MLTLLLILLHAFGLYGFVQLIGLLYLVHDQPDRPRSLVLTIAIGSAAMMYFVITVLFSATTASAVFAAFALWETLSDSLAWRRLGVNWTHPLAILPLRLSLGWQVEMAKARMTGQAL